MAAGGSMSLQRCGRRGRGMLTWHPPPAPPCTLCLQMARVIDDLAARTPGKKSLATAAFARALRQIPTIICDNAGGWLGLAVLLLP